MDRDFLIDLFADFGPVTIRQMFSGFGISADGTNFALALRAGLYFRADEQTIPQFEAEGSQPFQYQTRTKTVTVNSYWQLPARLFDDSEELARLGEGGAGRQAQRAALAQAAEGARRQGRRPAKRRSRKAAKQAGCWSQDGEGASEQGAAAQDGECARRCMATQATWLRVSAAYSGSTSQITRLRPLRLAA